jgi:RNA polymerase sigma factor (sigma-70 family)
VLDAQYQYINELVVKTKAGDTDALSELVQYYRPLILASIKRCLIREPKLIEYREDIEQEAYLILNELVQQYDETISLFSYYLLTRLDYRILSRARRFIGKNTSGQGIDETRFSNMPEQWEPIHIVDPFNRVGLQEALTNAIDQLSDAQQEAIDLYFYQGLNQQEAALALNITQASFSKRLNRALLQLREILPDDFCE